MTALKPQDVLVLLKLAVMNGGGGDRTYPGLAAALGLSPSEVHASVRRAQRLGLVDADRRPIRAALLELLIHGVKYVFAVERGGGLPTAHAAPPLAASLRTPGPRRGRP